MLMRTAAGGLRGLRIYLWMSQGRLARLAGVSRFKLCTFELGDPSLSEAEQRLIPEALVTEVERLRTISTDIEFDEGSSKQEGRRG